MKFLYVWYCIKGIKIYLYFILILVGEIWEWKVNLIYNGRFVVDM